MKDRQKAEQYHTARAFQNEAINSEAFGKCLVNFPRGDKYADKTIAEVCREYNKRENMRMLMLESK